MTALTWSEAAIAKSHDRGRFDCGDIELNIYMQRYARQNHQRGAAKCFVAAPSDQPEMIMGYYTISPGSIEHARTPAVLAKGLGAYEVPVFRLGRLAVDKSVQGRGLGSSLLFRAGVRCMQVAEEIGGVGLLIDAKNDVVALWYERHGALRLLDAPLSLILPFSMITEALTRVSK